MNNQVFLNDEQIKEIAPSVFTSSPSHDVSSKYTFIPTSKVIDDMRSLGWDVCDVKEVKARKNSGYQKHLVIFRNNDVFIQGDNEEDVVYPQILLTNSHDGKNSFRFQAGLFRMICSNGLVISTETFEAISIRHMGYDFDELEETIKMMVERLPLTVESMNKMKEIEMDQKLMIEFANEALKCRFSENEMNRIEVDLDDLLIPVRNEDKGNDLWTVYNVVQEKLIEGDFDYNVGTKVRKARKIKNFKQDCVINEKLFDLAMAYVN